jgi:hypothetical protein
VTSHCVWMDNWIYWILITRICIIIITVSLIYTLDKSLQYTLCQSVVGFTGRCSVTVLTRHRQVTATNYGGSLWPTMNCDSSLLQLTNCTHRPRNQCWFALQSESVSESIYDRQFTANQSVLAPSLFMLMTRGHSPLWREDRFVSYEETWPWSSVLLLQLLCFCVRCERAIA